MKPPTSLLKSHVDHPNMDRVEKKEEKKELALHFEELGFGKKKSHLLHWTCLCRVEDTLEKRTINSIWEVRSLGCPISRTFSTCWMKSKLSQATRVETLPTSVIYAADHHQNRGLEMAQFNSAYTHAKIEDTVSQLLLLGLEEKL